MQEFGSGQLVVRWPARIFWHGYTNFPKIWDIYQKFFSAPEGCLETSPWLRIDKYLGSSTPWHTTPTGSPRLRIHKYLGSSTPWHTTPTGSVLPYYRGFTVTLRHTTETSTWQHTTLTRDSHGGGGIRTRRPSKRTAAYPRLRPRGNHWDL
jgi:hypothetical protein